MNDDSFFLYFRCGEGMQGGCPGGELPPGAPPEQLPTAAAALDQAQFEADKRAVYKYDQSINANETFSEV